MNIDYKVLWFEDEPKWYDSILPVVENYLSDNGFNFIPTLHSSGENLEEILKKDDYDLILVDFNLPGEHGDKLIEKLRRFELYTDIIFYSQNGENKVREVLQKKAVEGVYCSGRNREDFKEKVTNVIHSNIKKVLDLNNMRGIVVAKVSDLDLSMKQIIIKKIEVSNTEETENIKKNALDKVTTSLKDKLSKISSIDLTQNFIELIERLDSYTKWRVVYNICKKDDNLKEYIELVKNYDDEILSIRNKMAHLKEDISEDGSKILKSINDSDNFIFNDAKSIEIRTNIKKYDETFNKIFERL